MQVKQRQPIEQRPDDHEYWTVAPNGHPIQRYWSEMARTQKLLQIEAERRAEHEALFKPNDIA